MKFDFLIEEAVKKRYSVRNYSAKPVEEEKRKKIKAFVEGLENPLGNKVTFHYLENDTMENEERLGTYGVIKGAKQYIGTTINLEPMSLEALGYEFEALVLYLTHLDIGTCWLGGTFDREGFAEAMEIKEGEIFPIITPYGYAADQKHEKEIEMRKFVQADHRKGWEELFYKGDFKTPLSKDEASAFASAFEMVRLGPSASNKQPWRLLKDGNKVHFFEFKEPGYSDRFRYDIQRVDIGIAAAHFDAAVQEKGIEGVFYSDKRPNIDLPEHIEYVFTWEQRK